jgi:hypothetical protein
MSQSSHFGAGVHPDLPTSFVHFTGRPRGPKDEPPPFAPTDPEQRLVRILQEGYLRAAPTWGTRGPVLCVSESTSGAIAVMLGSGVTTRGPYAPWALLLDRHAVIERGFRPIWHMSPAQLAATDGLPTMDRDLRIRYEPGEADWLAEREWRRCYGDAPDGGWSAPRGLELTGLLTGVIVGRKGWMPPPLVTIESSTAVGPLMRGSVTVTRTKFADSVDEVPRLWWDDGQLKDDGAFDLRRQIVMDVVRPWE